jgi:hypothetical protein
VQPDVETDIEINWWFALVCGDKTDVELIVLVRMLMRLAML